MGKSPQFKVGDLAVFWDGFPGPYPYLGVVEALSDGQLTFRGLEVKTTFTRPVGDFAEADEEARERATKLKWFSADDSTADTK